MESNYIIIGIFALVLIVIILIILAKNKKLGFILLILGAIASFILIIFNKNKISNKYKNKIFTLVNDFFNLKNLVKYNQETILSTENIGKAREDLDIQEFIKKKQEENKNLKNKIANKKVEIEKIRQEIENNPSLPSASEFIDPELLKEIEE